MSVISGDVSSYEPLVGDDRLNRVVIRTKLKYPLLDTAQFATAIQPAYDDVPELALFLIVQGHPKRAGVQVLSHAYTRLAWWREAEIERDRYDGPDLLPAFFSRLAAEHNARIDSLKDLIV